ncbi:MULTISPECIES: hypothetical protein [unclassified Kitasatospora]|uniref:hypothetical protein n=1 Tax=unclassified Kitasatospora TaxID=2633591 RepID=UPI0037FE7610
MRTALRTALTVTLLGAAALTPALGTAEAADAAPREVNQGYSIPVGAITDLGALPVLGHLGTDFARLLGPTPHEAAREAARELSA